MHSMTPVLATITVPALLLFASVAAAESPGPLRGPLPAKIAETLTAPAISVEGGEVSGH